MFVCVYVYVYMFVCIVYSVLNASLFFLSIFTNFPDKCCFYFIVSKLENFYGLIFHYPSKNQTSRKIFYYYFSNKHPNL